MSEGPLILSQARGGLAFSVTTTPQKISWPGCSMGGVRLHNSSVSESVVVVAVVDEVNSEEAPTTHAEVESLLASGGELGYIWGERLPGNSGWIPFGGRTGTAVSVWVWTKEETAELGAIFCR